MGMFDYININTSKLPVSDSEREELDDVSFRTQDLSSDISTLDITDDGRLVCDDKEVEMLHGKPFHGYLNFFGGSIRPPYTHYEFNAKFTDGKLVDIERVKR